MNKIDHRRKSVLILECDSDKLTRQGLAVGTDLRDNIKLVMPKNAVDLIQTHRLADLLESLSASKPGQRYKTVVIIGHSNRDGLKITADRFDEWKAVSNWISPFRPDQVILLGCEGGRWLPCSALFDGISTLKEVFGSPVTANKDQRHIVLARVLSVLGSRKEEPDAIRLMLAVSSILTKGIMFRRTRAEYKRGGDTEGILWSMFAEPLLERLIAGIR